MNEFFRSGNQLNGNIFEHEQNHTDAEIEIQSEALVSKLEITPKRETIRLIIEAGFH